MNDLQLADDILSRIRARGGQYHERAYLFVLGTIEFLQTRLEMRRHVTGPELAWACRDFARQQFGLLASVVLSHWGITRTEDIGRIVFTLVEVGLLVTQPGDSESDFEGVYQFAEVFGESYEWQGLRGA
ncbi:MAG TPA: Minf_1886 family protein [Micromonosporaceae bacterium]|nr:Minf_1886 family protein [Micromonosporaceae bacterium]